MKKNGCYVEVVTGRFHRVKIGAKAEASLKFSTDYSMVTRECGRGLVPTCHHS